MIFKVGMRNLWLGGLFFSALFGLAFAGESENPVRFVVYGDTQPATNSATSGVKERLAVPMVINQLNPDFVLMVGDLMDHGEEPGAYDNFLQYQKAYVDRIPLFPTMGNHDARGVHAYKKFLTKLLTVQNPAKMADPTQIKLYFNDDENPYPGSYKDPKSAEFRNVIPTGVTFKTYYAFQYKNCFFISMEVGTRWWSNTPLPWLESKLKMAHDNPEIDHIFVYLHHPVYSTAMADNPPNPAEPNRGECIMPVRNAYEKLFQKYSVRMVFSGHVHNYEHLLVPKNSTSSRSFRALNHNLYPLDDQAIHYLVTGGGGGPLGGIGDNPASSSYKFRQNGGTGYHVLSVEVDGKKIQLEMIKVAGDDKNFSGKSADKFIIMPPNNP